MRRSLLAELRDRPREIIRRMRRWNDGPANPAPLDVNLLLHQSRAAMLRHMPAGARTLLSAGCAGTWYFGWVEQCYGRVSQHIGIEFYSPRPTDLLDNVNGSPTTYPTCPG